MERNPDYLTYIELMRAFGKGGALPQALQLFEKMCGSVWPLPLLPQPFLQRAGALHS